MASKYGKLIMNLGNVLDAAVGEAASRLRFVKRARAEAAAVLKAAGIAYATSAPTTSAASN